MRECRKLVENQSADGILWRYEQRGISNGASAILRPIVFQRGDTSLIFATFHDVNLSLVQLVQL